MVNTCSTCKKRYEMDATNTLIFLYGDRTYMDNVQTMCENGHEELLFFSEAEDRDDFLRKYDELTIVRDAHPSEGVIRAYCLMFDIELVEPVDLTARHEAAILQLGDILTNTPDDLLMEVFTHPPPKSQLPRRWT